MKTKAVRRILMGLACVFAATLVIYWFNLDNKLIYYGVRPILNKVYDKQERQVSI